MPLIIEGSEVVGYAAGEGFLVGRIVGMGHEQWVKQWGEQWSAQ